MQKLIDFATEQAEQIIIEEITSNDNSPKQIKKQNQTQHKIPHTVYNSPLRNQKEIFITQDSHRQELNEKSLDSYRHTSPRKYSEELSPLQKMNTHVKRTNFHNQNSLSRKDTITLTLQKNINLQLQKKIGSESQQNINDKIVENYNYAKENFNKINKIIDDLEEPQENVDKYNNEFKQFISGQEETKSLVKNYGRKMKNLLDKWCDNEEFRQVISDPKLQKYRHETWGDLIDFEKKLKDEMQRFHSYQERLKFSSYMNIDWIKQKTSNYVESLEFALNECKLKNQQIVERLQMTVEDYESKAFNVLDDNDFMKSALEVQKEITDQKDITNFRGAMQQVNRLKQVLEKLHKDYIKMVSQSKQMHDDIQLFKEANDSLTKQLENQKITNENLLDIISTVMRSCVLYKDDQIIQTSRKTINEIDPKSNDKFPIQLARFFSFMRMYPPIDLVTPLRKECETLKQLLYVLIEYLQSTGQINKYWIPQFEDTDEQYKTTIDGWHKNYLVTVMENETLQFMMRFKQNNLQLPFKFQIPQHVIDREKNQKPKQVQIIKEDVDSGLDLQSQSNQANGQSETFITDNKGINELNQDEKSSRQNRGTQQSSTQNIAQKSQNNKLINKPSQTRDNSQQNLNKQNNNQNKTKSQNQLQNNTSNNNTKQQQQSLNYGNVQQPNQKPFNQDLSLPQKRKLERRDSKNIIQDTPSGNNSDIKIDPNKRKSLNQQYLQAFVKNIKLPSDTVPTICHNIQSLLKKETVDKLILKYKNQKQEQDKNEQIIKNNEEITLSEQEQKIYYHILINVNKQSQFMDAANLLKVYNEFIRNYFQEEQLFKASGPNQQNQTQFQNLINLLTIKNQVVQIRSDKALEFLASNKSDIMSLQELLNLTLRLNLFLTNDIPFNQNLKDLREFYQNKAKEELNIPNEQQLKILTKFNKIRENLKQRFENDNQIGEAYIKLESNKLKVNDIWTIVNSPFFKYGINEISILKALRVLDTNISKLSKDENFYVVSDLIRYKLPDPNVVFEDYLQKQMKKLNTSAISPKSPLSQNLKAFSQELDITNTDNQQDILQALKNINSQITNQIEANVDIQSEEQVHSDIVINVLSPRSTTTYALENNMNLNATQSAFSASELSQQKSLNLHQSPLNVLNQRINSNGNQDIDKRIDQQKIKLIRQETIKTIKCLQDFVKQSVSGSNRANVRQKQDSFIKLANLQSFSDNLQQMEKQQASQSPQKPKLIQKSSFRSLTIEESSEQSSQDQMNVLMRFTQGQKSTYSRLSNNNKSNFRNQSLIDEQQHSKNQIVSPTAKNKVIDLTPKNNPLHSNSFMNKSPSPSKRGTDIMNDNNVLRKISNQFQVEFLNSQDQSQSDQGNDYGFEEFQNQKEQELFGGVKKQLRGLDNNIYLKKMKEFDSEIEKLKIAHKNKKAMFNQTQNHSRIKKIKGMNTANSSPRRLFDFNILDLSQRMNQLEKNQEILMKQKQNINIVNSNIHIDNSYVPDMFMKKIMKLN